MVKRRAVAYGLDSNVSQEYRFLQSMEVRGLIDTVDEILRCVCLGGVLMIAWTTACDEARVFGTKEV